MFAKVMFVVVLSFLAGAPAMAASPCGDVNRSGTVSSSDALAVLKSAVGQPVTLLCDPSGGISRTGQTTCYDGAGGQIDCPGSGQDGEWQVGVDRSFTDNGDGTVTDDGTGLTWEKLSDDGGIHDKDTTYVWTAAIAGKIADLNAQSFAGHSDWRLPNRFELDSIVSLGQAAPSTYAPFSSSCTGGCSATTCSCTRSDYYWSSSTYQSAATYAWSVYFSAGDTQASQKSLAYYVRAVRGGR